MAFIFADLIVLPIVLAYRKYYGTAFALRIIALMFVTMVARRARRRPAVRRRSASSRRRGRRTDDVFGSIELDYKLVLNAVATGVFVGAVRADAAPRRRARAPSPLTASARELRH